MPSTNDNPQQLTRNAAANYLTLVTQLVSGLVITPLLFRHLGPAAFGTYSLMVIAVAYVGLFELGVGTATLRAVAVAAASDDTDQIHRVLGSSRSLYLPIIGVSALVFGAIVVLAPGLPGASGTAPSETRMVLGALSLAQLCALFANVYPAYVYGTGRADILYGVGVLTNVLLVIAQGVVVVSTGNVVALAVVTAAVSGFNALLVARLAQRMLGRRVRRRDAEPETSRGLVRFGLRNAGVSLAATLSQQGDLLVVGALLPAPRVAAYAVASRVAAFGKTLATRAMDVLVPTFAHGAAGDDDERQFRYVVESSLFCTAILLPLPIVCLAYGKTLLSLWIGSAPADSDTILFLLTAAAALQATGGVAFAFFNGRGDLRIFLRTGSVFAVINLAASVVLAVALGVVGPAIGTLGGVIAFDLLILPRATAKRLGQSTSALTMPLWRALAPPAAAAALMGVLVALLPTGETATALLGSAAIFATFYGCLIVTVGTERRATYARVLRRS